MDSSPPDLESRADQAAASGDLPAARQLLEQAVTTSSSVELWAKLSAVRRATGDAEGALHAIEQGLSMSPLDFSALLARAFLLEKLGRAGSGEAFSQAIAQLPADAAVHPSMAKAVEHAKARAAEHKDRLESRLAGAIPAELKGAARARVERFVSNSSRRTRHYHQEPANFHYPGLPEVEFHDRESFPWLAELEARTDEIRAEYEALLAEEAAELVPYTQYPEHVPLAQWEALNNSRDWTAVHLLQNGARIEANAARCPRTLDLLAPVPQPQIRGAAPNAMFSLLAPRTRIPSHTGVANIRLVCHLPLIVPPNCGFRVGATTREWRVGEAFVFDDTIEHEAWNDSDELRVVLIFDVWAPALDAVERDAVARVIGAAGVSFKGG